MLLSVGWWIGCTSARPPPGSGPTGREPRKLRRGGIEDGEIQQGFVICTKSNPVPCVKRFKAQLQVHSSPQTAAAHCQSLAACVSEPHHVQWGIHPALRLLVTLESAVSIGVHVRHLARGPQQGLSSLSPERCVQVLELPKGLFTAGYKAVLHVHSVTEECEIQALISQIDPKTKTEKKARPMAPTQRLGTALLCVMSTAPVMLSSSELRR